MTLPTASTTQKKRAPLPKKRESDTLCLQELVIALAKQQARQDHKEAMKHDQSSDLR